MTGGGGIEPRSDLGFDASGRATGVNSEEIGEVAEPEVVAPDVFTEGGACLITRGAGWTKEVVTEVEEPDARLTEDDDAGGGGLSSMRLSNSSSTSAASGMLCSLTSCSRSRWLGLGTSSSPSSSPSSVSATNSATTESTSMASSLGEASASSSTSANSSSNSCSSALSGSSMTGEGDCFFT